MPAKICSRSCISSVDNCIIARFSASGNTKLRILQHGKVRHCANGQSPSALAGSASSPVRGAFLRGLRPREEPPHAVGRWSSASDDRRGSARSLRHKLLHHPQLLREDTVGDRALLHGGNSLVQADFATQKGAALHKRAEPLSPRRLGQLPCKGSLFARASPARRAAPRSGEVVERQR